MLLGLQGSPGLQGFQDPQAFEGSQCSQEYQDPQEYQGSLHHTWHFVINFILLISYLLFPMLFRQKAGVGRMEKGGGDKIRSFYRRFSE